MRILALLHLLGIVEANWNEPRDKSGIQKLSHPPEGYSNPYDIYEGSIPVDFINMGIEGILDPSSGLKQPVDLLAMNLRYPTSPEEEERLLKTTDPRKIIKIAKTPKPSLPRLYLDAMSIRQYNPYAEDKKIEDVHKTANVAMPSLFDFEKAQAVNMALPNIYRDNIIKAKSLFRSGSRAAPNEPTYYNGTNPNFPVDLVDLRDDFDRRTDNWTTCEEFAVKARFHPREVAGSTWVPFYKWAREDIPTTKNYEFSYPTKQLVQKYRTEYGPYLNKKVDWKQPMLVLKSWTEFLLVAGDRRGLFYGIQNHVIPELAKKPTLKIVTNTFRLKMVDQYLALMMCEKLTALMLATVDEVPAAEHMAREAAKLGFKGTGTIFSKTTDYDEDVMPKEPSSDYNVTENPSFYQTPKLRKTPFFNDDPFVT